MTARLAGWWVVSDSVVLAQRNLLHYLRVPSVVVSSVVSLIMFVLLFAYVFGAAISVPGTRYVDYLMGGILVQTVAFGSTETGVGWPTTCRTAWSTASRCCRWPGRRCWPAAHSPTVSATRS